MEMRLHPVEIKPELKGYIEKMWIFESSGRVPDDDMKLIVPNGLIKWLSPSETVYSVLWKAGVIFRGSIRNQK